MLVLVDNMKNLFSSPCLIILLLSCIMTGVPEIKYSSAETSLLTWGYCYHAAPLSGGYLDKNRASLQVIAVTGYRLDAKGRLRQHGRKFTRTLMKRCGSTGITVYPVISFASPAAGTRLLTSGKSAHRAVRSISRLVSSGAEGIHLDFEYLPPRYAPHLERFLKKLRKELPRIHLSMALFPRVDFPRKWSAFHDLPRIAPLIDEAVIMCYDYHRAGSAPGPVTSVAWAEKNIRHYLKHFSPRSLWLGIPAYGYIWPPKERGRVITPASLGRCRTCFRRRDKKSGTLKIIRNRLGKRETGYLSDACTRRKLKSLARRYRLKGTALWRLGLEEPGTL